MKTKIPPHRLEGAFLGLALGDAYGRTLEFVSGEAVQQNAVLIDSNTFMWSEETHISLYIADAVLQMPQSKFDADQFGHLVGSYMATWLDDPLMPSTNPGNTTLAGVRNYKDIKDWKHSGVKTGDGSAAITRLCPLALAYGGTVLDEAAQIAAQITHAHPNAKAAAFATVRLLRGALLQGTLSEENIEKVITEVESHFEAPDVVNSMKASLVEYKREDLEWLDDADMPLTDKGWRSPSTLGLSLIAALKWKNDIALAIEKSARVSGDSDAVASMTGMFLGALHGVTKLPNTWLSALPSKEDIRKKAHQLAKAVQQEILSIATQIRGLYENGASFSNANLQTNTLKISVPSGHPVLLDSITTLSKSIGEPLIYEEGTINIVIYRALIPNDVRHATSLHLPRPEGLQQISRDISLTPPTTSTTNVRTSVEFPIGVDWVLKGIGTRNGSLGCTFAPGKKARSLFGKPWDRSLALDLDRLRSFHNCDALVSLVQDFELQKLKIPKLVEEAEARGIAIYRSGITDGSVPTPQQAFAIVQFASAMSRSGHNVVFHCKGGLGRAGTLCACTMVALGHSPQHAIKQTRQYRKGAIENETQELFVHSFAQFLASQ